MNSSKRASTARRETCRRLSALVFVSTTAVVQASASSSSSQEGRYYFDATSATQSVPDSNRARFQQITPDPLLPDMNNFDSGAQLQIVGGSPATSGEFPFFAATAGLALCGASLIHEDILLSAAHCVDLVDAFSQGVYIGGTNLNPSDGEFFEVKQVLLHPNYDRLQFNADIMLAKLATASSAPTVPLNFDAQIPQVSDPVTVIGHGYVTSSGPISVELLKVEVDVVDPQTCQDDFGQNANFKICGGVSAGGKDACEGDSGGPLLADDGTQVGIVSIGYGCAQPGIPGIYTRVSYYQDFVTSGICQLSANPPTANCGAAPSPTTPQPVVAVAPTDKPSPVPVVSPTPAPTRRPTGTPRSVPTSEPTNPSSSAPSDPPTLSPTDAPSSESNDTQLPSTAEPAEVPTTQPEMSTPSLGPTENQVVEPDAPVASSKPNTESPSPPTQCRWFSVVRRAEGVCM